MAWLKLNGFLPLKTDAGIINRFVAKDGKKRKSDIPAGFPDLVVLHPNHPAFFVELKTERGRVSPLQAIVHQSLRSMGYAVYVVRGEAGVRELADRLAQTVEGVKPWLSR